MDLPSTPDAALAQHLAPAVDRPLFPWSGRAGVVGDDPGFLTPPSLDPGEVESLGGRFADDDLPAFNHVRIL